MRLSPYTQRRLAEPHQMKKDQKGIAKEIQANDRSEMEFAEIEKELTK